MLFIHRVTSTCAVYTLLSCMPYGRFTAAKLFYVLHNYATHFSGWIIFLFIYELHALIIHEEIVSCLLLLHILDGVELVDSWAVIGRVPSEGHTQ